jgi:transposase, IS5 family
MHQTKKGNQYYFGMKSHIGVDSESGLVHSLVGTAANVADVTQVDQLLHGEETYVCGDAGYTGVEKRPEHQDRQMIFSIAARPNSYKKHGKKSLIGCMRRKIEYAKGQVRAKVEHPFRVIKRQFSYTNVRFRGRSKNIAQQTALVRFIEPVDGAKTVVGYGRGASVMRADRPETARSEARAVN